MPAKTNSPIVEGIEKYFLLGALVLLITTLLIFISSFLSTIFISAIIATAFYPLYRFFTERSKISPTPATILIILLILILLDGVVTLFSISVVGEASGAYTTIDSQINKIIDTNYNFTPLLEKYPLLDNWARQIIEHNPVSLTELLTAAGESIGVISSFVIEQAPNIIKHLSVFLLHLVIFVLSLFYFIRDGKKIIDYIRSLIPLPDNYRQELFERMYRLTRSIIFGIFGTAVIQGVLLGAGFSFVGINNAAFWGAVAAFLSPLPYIGTSIIWIPAAISLFIAGDWFGGTFLTLWGLAIVGTSDNIVKPYIIGAASSLHPLAVMLAILGGAFTFGFAGLILGPFILTLTLSFLHIYELQYRKILDTGLPKIKKPIKK